MNAVPHEQIDIGTMGGSLTIAHSETCPVCGYDLTGLSIPCVCPECGRECDPPRDRAEAEAWFRSRQALFCWRPPPRFVRHLGDPACVWLARRRLLIWLVLPLILGALVLLAAHTVVVTTRFESWWVTPTGENFARRERAWDERLLSVNLFLEGLFGSSQFPVPPPGSVAAYRVVERSWAFDSPAAGDLLFLASYFGAPITTLALAPLVALPLALIMIEWDRRMRQSPTRRRAALSAITLMLPTYALGVAIHVVLIPTWHYLSFGPIDTVASTVVGWVYRILECIVLTWLGWSTVQILRGVRARWFRQPVLVLTLAFLLTVSVPFAGHYAILKCCW